MCNNNVQETNDVLRNIIIGVVSTLCLLIAITIIILLILVWFKKQRRKSKVPNTVSLLIAATITILLWFKRQRRRSNVVNTDSHNSEIKSVATQPVTTISSEVMLDIATTQNEGICCHCWPSNC